MRASKKRRRAAFAGIWQRLAGLIRKGGDHVELEVFAFFTATANALLATMINERRPVLRTSEADFAAWLTGSTGDAFSLMLESPLDEVLIVQGGIGWAGDRKWSLSCHTTA